MPLYQTPGVYIEEISHLPPSVAEVATAIPAFIGHTEFARQKEVNVTGKPIVITSLIEYEETFGKGNALTPLVELDAVNAIVSIDLNTAGVNYYLYDSIRLFFANGGGRCYILSIGDYLTEPALGSETTAETFLFGLKALEDEDEPTIICAPDAVLLSSSDLYACQQAMLAHCATRQDRFAVLDLNEAGVVDGRDLSVKVAEFRSGIGVDNLKYGAAYTPWLKTAFQKSVDSHEIRVKSGSITTQLSELTNDAALQDFITGKVLEAISAVSVVPPSGAIAGLYAKVDRERGVWKAPANVSLSAVIGPSVEIDANQQDNLNVDANAGKSINAIRIFAGKGTLVWGARTLAGNDNEWRYIPVCRFYSLVEESVKKSTNWAVFEPNDANTWVRVKTMIENYLTRKWREGALVGAKPTEAFFVRVGLGVTMTAQDVNEGKMIVEIGMAMLRPAEFIVLRFSQKMPVV